MSGFVLGDEARSDWFDAWAFVANDHPAAADKLERDILGACALLARQPGIGHRRLDLCDDDSVRFHTVRTWYLVVYEWDASPLRIVRILHGARDAVQELGDGWTLSLRSSLGGAAADDRAFAATLSARGKRLPSRLQGGALSTQIAGSKSPPHLEILALSLRGASRSGLSQAPAPDGSAAPAPAS